MRKIILWLLLVVSGLYFLANFGLLFNFKGDTPIEGSWIIAQQVADYIGFLVLIPVVYFIVIRNWKGASISVLLTLLVFRLQGFLYFYWNISLFVLTLIFAVVSFMALIYSIYSLRRAN